MSDRLAPSMEQSVDELAAQAMAAFDAEDYPTAAACYQAIVDREPGNAWARLNLMCMLMSQQRLAEALACGKPLLAGADDPSEGALINLGALLGQAPDVPDDAPEAQQIADAYERLLRADPANDAVRRNLTGLVVRFFGQFSRRYRPVMISSVGGSGTYFTLHFFEFLERRMGRYTVDYHPVSERGFPTVLAFPNLHCLKATTHGLCPGFEAVYHGPHRAAWDALVEAADPPRVTREVRGWLDPSRSPEARLVHIQRNPFDWTLTVFRQDVRSERLPDTAEALSTKATGPQIKRFVAQYFSFRAMRELYPDQIKIVRFEDLVADPQRVFRDMLSFFGVGEISPDLIHSCIRSSSPQALMKVEDRSGRPTGPTGFTTHFDRDRDARRRHALSPADRAAIIELFERLEISLDEFAPES